MPAVDPQLAAAIGPAARSLVHEIAGAGWPVDAALEALGSLSADYENNRELVVRAAARLRLDAVDSDVARIAGAVADLEAALRRGRPDLPEELAVRGRPLREQWEARGPGLLPEMGRLTDVGVVPETADIVLAAPYAGGGGYAYPMQNRVVLEAVLTNPLPELPETVRLGWLLCQLNADLPRLAEALPAGRAAPAYRLAMLAPALAAGAAVELCACNHTTLELALSRWEVADDLPADAAVRVDDWWQAWLDSSGRWPVAVAALEALLRPS